MAKTKKITTPVDDIIEDYDMSEMTKAQDDACDLIYKLIMFYNKNPNYETPLPEICTLARLANEELYKFMCRPHTQVTKIFFDSDAPDALFIK